MVSATGAFRAINKLLVENWPDRTVYVNLNMQDFERPSFSIDHIRQTRSPYARFTKDVTEYLTIRCFIKTDEYNHQEELELLELQREVLLLFDPGFIVAGDRSLKVEASAGGDNPGVAYVDVTVHYADDSAEHRPTYEPMQTLELELEKE